MPFALDLALPAALLRGLNAGKPDLDSCLRRSSGEGKGDILEYKPLKRVDLDRVQSNLIRLNTAILRSAFSPAQLVRRRHSTTISDY